MKRQSRWALACATLGLLRLSAPAFANDNDIVTKLSQSPRWLSLLHYHSSGSHRWKSTIDSPLFFFSPAGKNDPTAELTAFIDALTKPTVTIGRDQVSAACAFPARAQFVRENLATTKFEANCPDLSEWEQQLQFRSLSLVFSSAFAGNPASMFGHAFLKLNGPNDLLSYGFSFTAMANDDNKLMYAYKGITGDYPGYFSLTPYYEKVMEYEFQENRDLWEYELSLTPQEIVWLRRHIWELVHWAYADYYFLDENCSYFLLELLETVNPEWKLSEPTGFIVSPHLVIRRTLSQTNRLLNVRFRAAQRRTFHHRLQQTNDEDKQNFLDIIHRKYTTMEKVRPQTIDLILSWATLQKSRTQAGEQREIRLIEEQALLQRAKQKQTAAPPEPDANNRPDMGHNTGKMAVGYFYSGRNAQGPSLNLRSGFHSLLENDLGFEPWLGITYLSADVTCNTNDKAFSPKSLGWNLQFMEVEALSPSLLTDPQRAWTLAMGARSRHGVADEDGLYVDGSIGRSSILTNEKNLGAILLGGEVSSNGVTAAAAPRLQSIILLRPAANSRVRFDASWIWPLNEKPFLKGVFQLGQDLSQNMTLDVSATVTPQKSLVRLHLGQGF